MKTFKILFGLLVIFGFSGCMNNDFLERYPLGSPTAETVFKSYDNFKTYAWGLYETFPALGYGETNTDNISYNSTRGSGETDWIRGIVVPPSKTDNTPWAQYSFIRRTNLMLDHIETSDMTETERNHWRSVGYFFRSYRYLTLLSAYGGVPWIDHVLADDETDIIYGERDSRDVIANHILEDLQYAEQNINQDGDGANTINRVVVQTLLSRFCLFEGTWRKYHGLQDAEKFLRECKRASEEVLKVYPNVHSNYDDLFNSLSLNGMTGIILYKAYANDANVVHATSIGGTTAQSFYNVTRDMVDSYLCSDGKPRWTSQIFLGDKDMYDEFSNRDHRLWLHVTPPYVVDRSESTTAWDNKWKFTDNPKDRSFIDSINLIVPAERQKTLPFRQGYDGGILGENPHYDFFLNGQPWYKSAFGYNNWKYFNTYLSMGSQRNEETDMPIFRVEEVMLNYAEAMVELGEFSQSVADMTINKIRSRANVPSMIVSQINESFDPKRDLGDSRYAGDYAVSPLLWEVRRERRIELFSENFRFDDLRRWKKCHYAMKKKLGQYVRKSDFPAGTAVTIDGGADEGYLEFHPDPNKLWPDYYYLYPIPLNQMVLNPNIKQNPGWD